MSDSEWWVIIRSCRIVNDVMKDDSRIRETCCKGRPVGACKLMTYAGFTAEAPGKWSWCLVAQQPLPTCVCDGAALSVQCLCIDFDRSLASLLFFVDLQKSKRPRKLTGICTTSLPATRSSFISSKFSSISHSQRTDRRETLSVASPARTRRHSFAPPSRFLSSGPPATMVTTTTRLPWVGLIPRSIISIS